MSFKSLFAAAAVAAVLVAPPLAQAYQLTSQGVTFTITVTDAAAGQFTLHIDDLLDATGNWADVTQIGALQFGDLGQAYSVTGSTLSPGSTTPFEDELNANGCDGGASTGHICFAFNPLFAASNDMTFQIDLNGPITVGANGPHLKVNFHDAYGEQIGDLLSKHLPGTEVPEPTTVALLGLGLLGAPFLIRKKAC